MGMEDPHKWFTAGEVADLARRFGIGEVPNTKSGMIKWIKRFNTVDPALVKSLSKKRVGQKGGGGSEYYWTLFCHAGPRISDAMVSEAVSRAREYGNPDSDGWFTADEISFLAGLAQVPLVPIRATYFNQWVRQLARKRPKTFALDLKRLSRGDGSKSHEYHYTLFSREHALFATLAAERSRRKIFRS